MGLQATLAGFVLFPAIYSPQATHIIFGKAHAGSSKKASGSNVQPLPIGRTLFIVNVPPDATERELSLFFKPHGLVEKVVWDQNAAEEEVLNDISDSEDEEEDEAQMDVEDATAEDSTAVKRRKKGKGKKEEAPTIIPLPSVSLRTIRQTGRTAYVVFLDASSLESALASDAPHKPRAWPRPADDARRGLAHYMALHDALRPPLDAVRAHADSAMEMYDYAEAVKKRRLQKEAKYRKGEAVVDDDGFTLVTRGGAYGQTLGGGAAVASKKFEATGEASARKKKKRKKEMDNFYKFQVHEKKRQDLVNLKKKWEEDKAKVEKLKASRRFKPY
ncbi:hypothetical protein SCHPADRAFT_826254 [Schizopora paradoxa]|uniref:RRM domain-containing protein n=1 Tax=Schizopora paradoxa TaxID=27342 RepID=A0A0H2SC90_9AGAM|nr:hypothetical protein SCHPADRAFT_826254 [Schizopora paradoxa]